MDKDLEQRLKNTANLLSKFAKENLTEEQAKDVINTLPKFDEEDK
jgi:hypothetical protein